MGARLPHASPKKHSPAEGQTQVLLRVTEKVKGLSKQVRMILKCIPEPNKTMVCIFVYMRHAQNLVWRIVVSPFPWVVLVVECCRNVNMDDDGR